LLRRWSFPASPSIYLAKALKEKFISRSCAKSEDGGFLADISGMNPELEALLSTPKENLQHGRLDIKQIERDEAVNPMIIEN